MLLVGCLIVILSGTAVTLVGSWIPVVRANAAMRQVTFALTMARERAISEVRNMELQLGDNQLSVVRDEPGPGTTLVNWVGLEHGMEFMLFSGVPDTPDAFGRATAVDFGEALVLRFTSDGSLIDEQGVPINGTIFMGRVDSSRTARAVTVLGGTGRVRAWRWMGNGWEQ